MADHYLEASSRPPKIATVYRIFMRPIFTNTENTTQRVRQMGRAYNILMTLGCFNSQ